MGGEGNYFTMLTRAWKTSSPGQLAVCLYIAFMFEYGYLTMQSMDLLRYNQLYGWSQFVCSGLIAEAGLAVVGFLLFACGPLTEFFGEYNVIQVGIVVGIATTHLFTTIHQSIMPWVTYAWGAPFAYAMTIPTVNAIAASLCDDDTRGAVLGLMGAL